MDVRVTAVAVRLCALLRMASASDSRSALLILGIAVMAPSSAHAQSQSVSSVKQAATSGSAQFFPEPTGDQRCTVCHASEVAGYARSAMAQSLRRTHQEPAGVVTAHGTTITIHSSAVGYWQSWEHAGDKSNYKVDFVVGSGNHASGYLVDIGGHLFQSPVAYYRSRQSYDLAPGYEDTPDPDFTRPIGEECLLCHSGKALHISGTLNSFRPPIFAAEAITCERCHGPVERHLADPRAGTIVNPAKLEPAARDSVCEQCHLFGVARVPNPARQLSDFVPGQRMEDTYTIFHDAAPTGSSAGDFKVISHVEQLALSACARNSNGRLWCGTCHDPHDKPPQSLPYYRSRCLTCHTSAFPAAHPAKDSDCLACHMPSRDAKDGGHSAFTDHRIQRRPETLPSLPANTGIIAWRQPSSDLQKRNLGIAYIDVGMQRHSSQFVVEGYRMLTEVQGQFTNDPEFFKWIGEALLLAKQTPDAKLALERALQLDPGSALSHAGAAAPYLVEGDAAAATTHLEDAVALDPLYLPAASTLTDLYKQQGKFKEADALSARIAGAMNGSAAVASDAMHGAGALVQKRTEQAFKNIRVLRGLPAEQLLPTMKFIASSLGVECTYCHVESQFDKDTKHAKEAARGMIQMVSELNKANFDGRREVTCFSCHRGQPKPEGVPVLNGLPASSSTDAPKEGPLLPAGLPQVSQLLRRYVDALGGASAIEKVTSRVAKGTVRLHDQSAAIEIVTQAPGKQATLWHSKQGGSSVVLDGPTGWIAAPNLPVRDLHGPELSSARMDADLQFALHIREWFPDLRVQYPESLGDRKADVLLGVADQQLSAKLYFDRESGLLVRMVRFAETPLGRNPSQLDCDDYRAVDGVLVPFRITLTEPNSTSMIQLENVRQNVPIDPAIFGEPALDRAGR
jgi:photosynthetic reaction center cytochrome c subunit